MDKEHINDNEKSENPVNDTYDGKEKIIRENGGYSLLGNDIKYYVEIYNKLRPYRVLKIINSILLIILFVGSILASRYNLRWSNSMPSTMHCISHDAPPRYSTYCVSTGDTFAVGQLILVVLGLISLIYHHFAKNIFKAAVCSLMMSNAKLWMDGLNDYMISFPDCSPIEQKYALLGKIKIILWVKEL
uniref:ABC transmembrane type-1 domain-containing protein n=1 Tax=Meloidogyne hapla TaxID=6305 RepID=A0A1I8B3W9_MELHA